MNEEEKGPTATRRDDRPRLRAPRVEQPFHVVLVEPEIPPNTGNVARLCAATGCPLHLVEPLGFQIDEHAVRRAGLDYWHLVDVHTYPNIEALQKTLFTNPDRRAWYFSAHAAENYTNVKLAVGDALVFGRESTGLPASLLEENAERCLGIPTLGGVRSLNLANCVALGVYEGLRQNGLFVGAKLGK